MNEHGFNVELDVDSGVATLWMKMPGRANKVNPQFGEGFGAALELALGTDGLKGLIIASGHNDFVVGADLDFVYRERDAATLYGRVKALHAVLRRLETAGVPVVAALTGSALGGGLELALACHYRVALNDPKIQLGLPEVNLGVIPGGGGTQRLPRLIGLQKAMEFIAQGKQVRAPKAQRAGLVDLLVETPEALRAAALGWIAENARAKQPWDTKGFRFPGGVQPETSDGRNLFAGACAMLTKKTAGAYKAPEAAVRAIYEGSALAFDPALQVEARYFVDRVVSDQAKDMIRTFWYHRRAVEKQEGLPQIGDARIEKVGILGAGMMGAGLAFISALRGYDVVLKDIEQAALDAGLAHCEKQVGKRAKHLSAEDKQALLGRIHGTLDDGDLEGCDLVIEAVFENKGLKHRVTRETEAVLGDDAIFASNTSALPITDLATASKRPAHFIGLHFFSPVEQMPLVEVVCGEQTGEETLARALNFARRIKKTAIVVNDGYGFYTTRFFSAYVMEGARLVAEGHDPVLVEWAGKSAGMMVPPLKVADEVTLSLMVHGMESGAEYTGALDDPGIRLVKKLVAEGRTGKAAGAGFYDYGDDRRLWPGLRALAEATPASSSVEALRDRLLLVQALEAARCLDKGILREKRDAEIGAILGVGFAPNTGGPLAWMDRKGIRWVVQQLDALTQTHGDRYAAPDLLRRMAEKNERFFERV